MEITVKINDSLLKLEVGNEEYRFVEGTEENMIISAQGEVLKRYPKSYRYGGRKDYYEYVHPKQNVAGYLQVRIPVRNTTDLVHRLVAEAFLEKPEGYGKVEIDHRNHNRLDNRIENLRWCTHKANMSNISKCTEKTYYRDITAVDLVSGKEYFFKKPSDIIPLALERKWGQGWGYRLRKLLKQDGTAYGFYWTAKTKETVNIR